MLSDWKSLLNWNTLEYIRPGLHKVKVIIQQVLLHLYLITSTFAMQGCKLGPGLLNKCTVSAPLQTPALCASLLSSVVMDKKAKGLSSWFSAQRLAWAVLWNSWVRVTLLVGPYWSRTRDASNLDQLGLKWISWIEHSCCFDFCCVSAWCPTCGLPDPNIWC